MVTKMNEREELFEELRESLTSAVRYYQDILTDLDEGTYTPEKAQQDAENLMFNEGNNILSILESLGELSNETEYTK